MVVEGENLVLIDISAARLTMKETLVKLDAKSIEKDIDKIVDNAKQMTGAIGAFRQKKFTLTDASGNAIDPETIKTIYPLALVVSPIPRFWAFNKLIYQRLAEKNYLTDTATFDVLTAEDFDLLMRLVKAGHRISDVMQRKFSHPLPFARTVSLKNFVQGYDAELRESAAAVEWPVLGDAWFADVAATVKGWGLPVEIERPPVTDISATGLSE